MSERKMIYLCLAHMSEDGAEQKYVKEAFDTNWVVPMGPNVNAFEQDLTNMANSKLDGSEPLDRTVVCLSAGTAAVHLALIACGVNHISVTVNYLKEQIEEHHEKPRNGVQVKTVCEPKFLGTIGSIKFVEKFYNDTVLVMNSDLFTNIDYEDFFLHFQQHDAEMSVAAVPYNVSIPYGILDLDGRNIQGLLEKPQYNHYANAGIYLIKRRALDEIPEDTFFNATDLVEKLIAEGKKVIRYPLNGTWIDIGNPQEYQKAKDLVKHI